MIARVALIPGAGDVPPLDYDVSVGLRDRVRPGVRVLIPLGTRRATGIVTELLPTSEHPHLKPILQAIDPQPLLDDCLMRLCRWMADYYLCSLGEALSAALPGSMRMEIERTVALTGTVVDAAERYRELLDWLTANGPQSVAAVTERFGTKARRWVTALERQGVVTVREELRGGAGPTKRARYYRTVRALDVEEERAWRRQRPAQHALFTYLHKHPLGRASARELQVTFPDAAQKVAALSKRGLVAAIDEEVYRAVLPEAAAADRIVDLSAAQERAVAAVADALGKEFRTFLLWGVTGSGKTEVYLRCVASCLAAGGGALILVPEISLTHQLIDRVRARFGARVAVLHSGLSDGERWDEWRRIARGEAPIVVGARSAVFAPLARLGLVVVDEEHDSAYKQEDGIRYNGRDVAVMRAKLAGCPAVLGSATPAMETFHNGRTGRYEVLTLPQRVEARPLPAVDIVDLRRSSAAGRALMLSPELTATLKANLVARGQSLIFLNRRGYSNFLQCHQCGTTLTCPNCSVSLTLHRRWHALRCHHCDYTIPTPRACSNCGSLSLAAWGAGTEQVQMALRTLLPQARIGRMDRDTTSRKGTQREIITAWERRDLDILVGTQMITKGHDIPGVTLVGVLLADQSLNFPDFRAAERTFQLLTQVAGRAGRGTQLGRVIVQTLQPTHYSLRWAAQHDYGNFAEQELASRRELGYPPFARLVQLRCEGERLDATERVAEALAVAARAAAAKGVAVLGPAPAPLERLRGRFRWQLLLRGSSGASIRSAARAASEAVRRRARAAGVRVVVDVDPYSML